MKQIGLIDVDGHHFPNIALMKISAYHKSLGDEVEWYRIERSHYDVVYMAKVFSSAYSPDVPEPWQADKVVHGGTGYAIWKENGREVYHKECDPPLPQEIETIYPDYSIYPQYTGWGGELKKQTAFGFLTRGCPRACEFCHVVPKEGRCSHKVADLSQFWRGQGRIQICDPNILACKDAPELLDQLIASKAKIEFNQGLDARLINDELVEKLVQLKLVEPHFAMDTMKQIDAVERGLKLYHDAYLARWGKWRWRDNRVFVLINFDTTHAEDMERITRLQALDYWPYVMVYDKPNAPKIAKRLQRWTNNPFAYGATRDFDEYQKHDYKEVLHA